MIEINGDCATLGKKIANEHGHSYIREIFPGFCELEEDLSSANHTRYRRAIDNGIHPEQLLGSHTDVQIDNNNWFWNKILKQFN